MSKASLSQDLLDRFSWFFSPTGRYWWVFSRSIPFFSDSSRDVAITTYLCHTGLFRSEPTYLRLHWTWPIFKIFAPYGRYRIAALNCRWSIRPSFSDILREGRCHGNQFCGKINYPLALIATSLSDLSMGVAMVINWFWKNVTTADWYHLHFLHYHSTAPAYSVAL